jgi:NAD+ synthase (glutamine-hydrolysing)
MAIATLPFFNPYRHGFARVAVGVPRLRVADCEHNAERVLELAQEAHARAAALLVLPELVLTGYTCEDLFHQDALVDAAEAALVRILEQSRQLRPALVVGLPARSEGRLFNVAAVVHRGALLGVVPKSYLPNYRDYYEKRHFAAARAATRREITLASRHVPFGVDLVFDASDLPGFAFAIEICEDLWAPVPPAVWSALAGATVLCNPSASNVTVDKASYRELLVRHQSGQLAAAYLYAGAGSGESTTDLAWDGQALIAEYGEVLAASERFALDRARGSVLIVADLDLDRLRHERERLSSWNDGVEDHSARLMAHRHLPFAVEPPSTTLELERAVARFPYVPSAAAARDQRCAEAYAIQVHGLVQRLRATGIERVVIGVSGGLDSTQALLVAVQGLDLLELPRTNLLAYTMPGFATSECTLANARELMRVLGTSAGEIDIKPSARQMLADLDHPAARGEPVYDVTFENVQAGERTSHLFRLANLHRALVVGTGDLSELALGWCTYGVGDHMSHYNVNASVPKTLIQYLIAWVAASDRFGAETSAVLGQVLTTEISPELIPAGPGGAQRTEDVIGPFELQDFHLYQVSRWGSRPSKVAYLAHHAWSDPGRGDWPQGLAETERRAYSLPQIKHWLAVFLERFFATSQFKRSAMPNGPKVGSGGSLSPRSDWRAPSDASAEVWLRELRDTVP